MLVFYLYNKISWSESPWRRIYALHCRSPCRPLNTRGAFVALMCYGTTRAKYACSFRFLSLSARLLHGWTRRHVRRYGYCFVAGALAQRQGDIEKDPLVLRQYWRHFKHSYGVPGTSMSAHTSRRNGTKRSFRCVLQLSYNSSRILGKSRGRYGQWSSITAVFTSYVHWWDQTWCGFVQIMVLFKTSSLETPLK